VDDFFIVHLFTLTVGHLNHANLYLPIGPLRYAFNNPQMHLWHHAEELPPHRPAGANFGLTLSVWDYLFGTAYVPREDSHLRLGFFGYGGVFPHILGTGTLPLAPTGLAPAILFKKHAPNVPTRP
jgi:Fatty acid hydroxylase superfamily